MFTGWLVSWQQYVELTWPIILHLKRIIAISYYSLLVCFINDIFTSQSRINSVERKRQPITTTMYFGNSPNPIEATNKTTKARSGLN